MKAPVSTFHFGCSCGRDELSHLGHISFGSLSDGFNNRKKLRGVFWGNTMLVMRASPML